MQHRSIRSFDSFFIVFGLFSIYFRVSSSPFSVGRLVEATNCLHFVICVVIIIFVVFFSLNFFVPFRFANVSPTLCSVAFLQRFQTCFGQASRNILALFKLGTNSPSLIFGSKNCGSFRRMLDNCSRNLDPLLPTWKSAISQA